MKKNLIASCSKKVTIRVWQRETLLPALSLSDNDSRCCGHISLQTYNKDGKGIYASIWPNKDLPYSLITFKGKIIHSLEEDLIEAKGIEPDHIIELFSLDVVKIEAD